MQELAGEVVAAHGAVHVLINNAGIGHEAAFPQTSLDDWERIVDVNLWGVIYGCHFFMPHLAKVDRAHIVNVSSLFGIVAMPGQSAYCATKFAVRGLSESLWEELRATSVGLTVVHPAAVATDIMKTRQRRRPRASAASQPLVRTSRDLAGTRRRPDHPGDREGHAASADHAGSVARRSPEAADACRRQQVIQ